MKFLVLLLVSTFSALAQEARVNSEETKKIESINNYSPLSGEWAGEYLIKSAPEGLLEIIAKAKEGFAYV